VPCDCQAPGECVRHKITKTPPMHHLCKTSEEWFNKWESGVGPGQPGYDAEGGTPMEQEAPPVSQFVCPAPGCGVLMSAPMQAEGAKVECPHCTTPLKFVKIAETQLAAVMMAPGDRQAVTPTKVDEASPKPPPVARQAWNLARSLKDFVFDGMKTVTEEQYEERLAVCDDCPDKMRQGNRCMQCGCQLHLKARGRAFQCPLNHWPKITNEAG